MFQRASKQSNAKLASSLKCESKAHIHRDRNTRIHHTHAHKREIPMPICGVILMEKSIFVFLVVEKKKHIKKKCTKNKRN